MRSPRAGAGAGGGGRAFKQVHFQEVLRQSEEVGRERESKRERGGKKTGKGRGESTRRGVEGEQKQEAGGGEELQHATSSSALSSPVIAALSLLLLWNITALLTIVRTLSSGDWKYTMYFDDAVNFLKHKEVFSLYPFSWIQISRLVSHVGINVYEPVGSILKAIIFDLHGNESSYFRIWSIIMHFFNALLLSIWTFQVMKTSRPKNQMQYLLVLSASVTSLYVIHPLNVEVVCWASAQSYTLSLSFYLCASILFEIFLDFLHNDEQKSSTSIYTYACALCIYFFYALACLSKAPGITMPVVHLLRVAILPHNWLPRADKPSNLFKKLSCYFCFLAGVSAAIFKLIFVANSQGTLFAVVNYTRWDTKIIRAITTTWNFFQRVLDPKDLRVHYVLPPQNELTLPVIFFGRNNDHLYALLLALSVTFFLLSRRDCYPVALFSWLAYLVAWSPGVGLVNHGWSTFGSDRYCYIPLAMLVPGAVELLFFALRLDIECDPNAKKILNVSNSSKMQSDHKTYGNTSSSKSRTALLFCFGFGIYVFAYQSTFITCLKSWRNDKLLMESCLQHDPTDWQCHSVISMYYNFYEDDEEMATIHHDLAVTYMPDGEPKALLNKAAIHVEVNNYPDACAIYETMYHELNELEQTYHPYVLNNYAVCRAMDGVNFRHIQLSSIELNKALLIIDQRKGYLPEFVRDGVVRHLEVIDRYKQLDESRWHNIEYGVNFLY